MFHLRGRVNHNKEDRRGDPSSPVMEGNVQPQKTTPLARELTRTLNSYNKHSIQLKKNLKETNAFFREIRQNYSNACASTMSSDSASLEAGRSQHGQLQDLHLPVLHRHLITSKTPLIVVRQDICSYVSVCGIDGSQLGAAVELFLHKTQSGICIHQG